MPHASKFRRAARFKNTRASVRESSTLASCPSCIFVRLARRRPRPDSRQPTGARHPVRRFASRPRASRSVPPLSSTASPRLGLFRLGYVANVRAVSAERPGPDAQRLLHLQHETRTADGFPDVPRPSKHLRHRAFEKAPALPRVESIGVHGLRVVAFCARQRARPRAAASAVDFPEGDAPRSVSRRNAPIPRDAARDPAMGAIGLRSFPVASRAPVPFACFVFGGALRPSFAGFAAFARPAFSFSSPAEDAGEGVPGATSRAGGKSSGLVSKKKSRARASHSGRAERYLFTSYLDLSVTPSGDV